MACRGEAGRAASRVAAVVRTRPIRERMLLKICAGLALRRFLAGLVFPLQELIIRIVQQHPLKDGHGEKRAGAYARAQTPAMLQRNADRDRQIPGSPAIAWKQAAGYVIISKPACGMLCWSVRATSSAGCLPGVAP